MDSVVFGMYGDADVGGPSSFSDDDAWFDTENDMVFQWDHDNWSTSYGGFKPAYFGWSFLESPGNPNDGIDNDGDGLIDGQDDNEFGDPRQFATKVAIEKIAEDVLNEIMTTW